MNLFEKTLRKQIEKHESSDSIKEPYLIGIIDGMKVSLKSYVDYNEWAEKQDKEIDDFFKGLENE